LVPVAKENEHVLKYNPEAGGEGKSNGKNGSQKDYLKDEEIKME
jgi:non-homologous end joining protein Ku